MPLAVDLRPMQGCTMTNRRLSGILLHVTSLPGGYGIGDFGDSAYRFIDFLARTGQGLWQVLPLGPTGYGNSPYQCYSAFAGNPLLVSLDALAAEGLLTPGDLRAGETLGQDTVDFDRVVEFHTSMLRRAFENSRQSGSPSRTASLNAFAGAHQYWLGDYTLFRALKTAHGGRPWHEWDSAVRKREDAALKQWRARLADEIAYETFVQHQFFQQWHAVKQYANERGIQIIGDIPIFVAHDSADVWSHQDLFALREDGRPEVVAGVPPDYFSATGQLWGNPLYRWDEMATDGYQWWIERIRGSLEMFDQIRIDHFRGFESYWEVPGDAKVASGGRWVLGPGNRMFAKARETLGEMPLIAEDLGVITAEVEALRDDLGFPGMRVLQFAFGDDPKSSDYQPHNYPRHCVVYTGTHDNDTVVGWFHSGIGEGTTRDREQIERERRKVLQYTGTDGREIHWDMIRLALASVGEMAIFPMQDLLGLGTKARMNMPGTAEGNWSWRFTWQQLSAEAERRLQEMTEVYQRTSLVTPQ
jgi:4-alpha-glucanotransferase